MTTANIENGYTNTDIALTIIFTMGIVLYIGALILEYQSGAPHYILMATAGSLTSISATFMATLTKKINITIKHEE